MKYRIGLTDKNKSKMSSPHARNKRNLGVSSSELISRNRTSYRGLQFINPFNNRKKSKDAYKTSSKKNTPTGKKSRKFRQVIGKVFSILFGIFFFAGVIGIIWVSMWLKELEKELPKPGALVDRSVEQSTVIYDRNGVELYKFYSDQNRTYINLDDLPPEARRNLIVSILAAEDFDFYNHKGLDWPGIIYCGAVSTYYYFKSGDTSEGCGASTVSQQLVRNTLMQDVFGEKAFDRSTFLNTVLRKTREMLLTMQVEQTMTKDQLLEMYINEIGMGDVNYGFEAGSLSIFGKSTKEISLGEAALLAGIVPSPSIYNPVVGSQPEKAIERQDYVIDQIEKHKDSLNLTLAKLNLPEITDEEIQAARDQELVYKPARLDIKAPHFVFYVREQLDYLYGAEYVNTGGLKVYTTLDWESQQIGEQVVLEYTNNLSIPYGIYNGSLIAINPKTGHIVTMVGSVDYYNISDKRVDGNVNVSTSPQQMGSAVKPITYLTAFSNGYGPWLETPDVADMKFGWNLSNWDYSYQGPMNARKALVQSRNIPAVYTLQLVGIEAFLQTVEKLGIDEIPNAWDYGLSLTLGSADMKLIDLTSAYSVFAAEGVRRDPVAILKVEDNKGKVIYEWKDDGGTRVFDEKDIYMLNYTICDLGGFGDQLGNWAYTSDGWNRMMCGKSGSTDEALDLTGFVYHKNIAVGGWNGNNDNTPPAPGAWSSTITIPMVSDFLKRVAPKYPPELYSRPAGVEATMVCTDTGRIATAGNPCPKTQTVYVVGKGPQVDKREAVKVCTDSGLISTNVQYAEKYGVLSTKWYTDYNIENPNQRDAIRSLYSKLYGFIYTKPESGECKLPLGPGNIPVVDILTPADGTSVNKGSVLSITLQARALGNVEYVQLYLDGVPIPGGYLDSEPYSLDYTVNTSGGTHILSAIAEDDLGKISEESSVTITVIETSIPVTVNITSPANGSNPASPVTFSANTTGSVSSVTFTIRKTSLPSSADIVVVDSNGADGWSIPVTFPPGSSGSYSVTATTNTGVSSSAVTFTL